MIRNCDRCGRIYEYRRNTSRYCCDACRRKANRKPTPWAPSFDTPAPIVGRDISADEVLQAVLRAHDAAADLSRAGALAVGPLSPHLSRAAVGIEDVLRGEGL